MVIATKLVISLAFLLGVFIQESFQGRVPEKIEHTQKGSSEYNVHTIKMTGNQHTTVDDEEKPPWPLRPGRRSFISLKARNSIPTIMRPGRSLENEKRSPQNPYLNLVRPGRSTDDNPQIGIIRPGRDAIPQIKLIRPGRDAIPQVNFIRPGRDSVTGKDQSGIVVRPGKRSIHYNMPWTYQGSSVDTHAHRKTHTFRQKAEQEDF